MTELERAARALYEEIGFVRGVNWPPPAADRYRNGARSALHALLPPSEEAVERVAEALMLADPANNPAKPPRYPRDFSQGEQWALRNQARAAITAYITLVCRDKDMP